MQHTFVKADPGWAVIHPVTRNGHIETVHLNNIIGWVLDGVFQVAQAVCVDGHYLPTCAIVSPDEYVSDGEETFQCIEDYIEARKRELN